MFTKANLSQHLRQLHYLSFHQSNIQSKRSHKKRVCEHVRILLSPKRKTKTIHVALCFTVYKEDKSLKQEDRVSELKSIYELRHEKTNILHMRKQRRRSASR